MVAYNDRNLDAVMDSLTALPSKIGPPPASRDPTPIELCMTTMPLRTASQTPTPENAPLLTTQFPQLHITPPPPILPSPPPLLIDIGGLEGPAFSNSEEEEGTPPPDETSQRPTPPSASSASRVGQAVDRNAEGADEDAEGEDDEEEAISLGVANRTRQKTKPAAPEGSKGGFPGGAGAGVAGRNVPSKKRKGPVDGDNEGIGEDSPKKKSKAAPKATKAKPAGKKAT